jgi:hypothetical protein
VIDGSSLESLEDRRQCEYPLTISISANQNMTHLNLRFGSSGRYPNMGTLEYSVEMALALELKKADSFAPLPTGQKAVEKTEILILA